MRKPIVFGRGRVDDAEDDTMVVDSIDLFETYSLGDASGMRETADGYIVVEPRVARTGIQNYLGRELGRPELQTVRVYRPESTVFNRDALASLAHRPITLGHPPEMVNAKNWKKYAIGQSGDEVVRDGHAVRVPMTIMDAGTFKGTTAREVSVGYTTEIAWKAGVTDSGEEYDAVQQKIRANHIAIVPQARGGSRLRLGDSNNRGVKQMVDRAQLDRTIVVDGLDVTLEDRDAIIVQRTISKLNDEVTKLRDEATKAAKVLADTQTELATTKKTVEAKDGEILVLKKSVEDGKLTPDLLDKAVAARTVIIDSAKKVLGVEYTGQGKTEAQIKREVVDKHFGDMAKLITKDGEVDGAFLAITAGAAAVAGPDTRRLGDALSTPRVSTGIPAQDARKAWDERNVQLEKAWQATIPAIPQ